MPDIEEDACVDSQHDGEGDEVEHGPEDQVTAAVEGRHGGAVAHITQTLPAHGRHQAHDDGHCPDKKDDEEDSPRAHLTVQLHVEDGLVPLHGHSQEVEHRGRQAGVDQPLTHKPLGDGQILGPGPSVEHHIQVGHT